MLGPIMGGIGHKIEANSSEAAPSPSTSRVVIMTFPCEERLQVSFWFSKFQSGDLHPILDWFFWKYYVLFFWFSSLVTIFVSNFEVVDVSKNAMCPIVRVIWVWIKGPTHELIGQRECQLIGQSLSYFCKARFHALKCSGIVTNPFNATQGPTRKLLTPTGIIPSPRKGFSGFGGQLCENAYCRWPKFTIDT